MVLQQHKGLKLPELPITELLHENCQLFNFGKIFFVIFWAEMVLQLLVVN